MSRRKATKAANLFLRGEVYSFRKVGPDGKRVTVSTGCKDLEQAKRRKTELEKELNNETFGWKKKRLAPLVVDWLQHALTLYGKTKHGRAFQNAIGLATTFWNAHDELPARIDEVRPEHCAMFLNWMRDQGFANNTVRQRVGVIRAIWNHAIAAEHVTKNPWRSSRNVAAGGITLPKAQPRKRILKDFEQPRLLAVLAPTWRRAAEFDILTGLRHDELVRCADRDFDFVQQRIRVVGKGDKERFVPLSSPAALLARAQMAARDNGTMGVRVLPAQRKRIEQGRLWPFSAGAFLAVIAKAAKKAKLDHLTVHDLRRTFGTRCALSKPPVPMPRLQEWMGHASITTTATFYVASDTKHDIELMAGLCASVPAAKEDGNEEVATKVVTFR